MAFGILGVISAVIAIVGLAYACSRRLRTFLRARAKERKNARRRAARQVAARGGHEVPFVSPWTGPSTWLLSSGNSAWCAHRLHNIRAVLIAHSHRYQEIVRDITAKDNLYPAGPDWGCDEHA
jgi:hypothetical protein